MHARLIAPADWRTMPWKNGQGITHELAVARSTASPSPLGFDWRLSIAEVAASAPFSTFAGCDRTIVLLAGDGMVLDGGSDGSHVLAEVLAPYAFPGERPIDCRLLGGPCRDFNVMVARSRARAAVEVLSVGSTPQRLPIRGTSAALYTATGSLRVLVDGRAYEVPQQHTLLWECEPIATPQALSLSAPAGEARGLLVVFTSLVAHESC